MSRAVELRGIDKRFRAVHALRGVDLTLAPGRIHALIGPNGAGKSTLIKTLGGAIAPDAGTVVVDGEVVGFRSPADAQAAGIAVVHQEGQLFGDLSVADNVVASAPPHRRVGPIRLLARREARRRAAELLRRLGVTLDPRIAVSRLPVAERKMVEVARALAADAAVLVLDEPTAALDPEGTARLSAVIRRLREEGVAILYVSHKLDEVLELSDEVTVLRDGEVVDRRQTSELDLGQLIDLLGGRSSEPEPAATQSGGQTLLAAREVAAEGLRPTSVELVRGQILALTGLMGSGATTFARVLSGAERATHGTVMAGGRRVTSRVRGAELGIGVVPEDRRADGIVPELSIEDNIALGDVQGVCRHGIRSRRRSRVQAERLIGQLGITPPVPDMRAGNLSGGNQQKVLLARWLASGARVIVAEEPMHGLDVAAKSDMADQLRRFVDDGGSVVIVSLDLAEYLGLPTEIGVFRAGQLVDRLPGSAPVSEVRRRAAGG